MFGSVMHLWCLLFHHGEFWPLMGKIRCKQCLRVRRIAL